MPMLKVAYQKLKLFIKFILELNRDIFVVILIFYLVIILLEQIQKGFISYHLNLNTILLAVIITGFFSIFAPKVKQLNPPKSPMERRKNLIITILFSQCSFLVIFFVTKELGWISYLISIFSGILIFILGYLLTDEQEETEE